MNTTKVWYCLTCGSPCRGWGNNPSPINDDPSLADRQVCSDCNAMYVIPARLGRPVSGDLFNVNGVRIGAFGTAR